MAATKHTMKMPELLVFAKMFVVGLVAAEVCRTTYYLGTAFASVMADFSLWARAILVLVGLAVCVIYAVNRGAHLSAVQMGRSLRLDLLIAMCLGAWSNELAMPWLSEFHAALKASNPYWAAVALLLLCTVFLSPVVQRHWPRRQQTPSQLRFLADEEIGRENDDLLSSETQAKSFAETVIASGAQSGLVFGVDGGCAEFCVNGQFHAGASPHVRKHHGTQETRRPRRTTGRLAGQLQETRRPHW